MPAVVIRGHHQMAADEQLQQAAFPLDKGALSLLARAYFSCFGAQIASDVGKTHPEGRTTGVE